LTLATVAALGAAGPARAASRVALSPFQGPGAAELRTAMIARLPGGLQVLPPRQTDRTFAAQRGGWDRTPAQWASVARRLNVAAVVDGRIWSGKQWRVRLVVRGSRTGAPAGTLVWSGDQPRALIEDVLREAPAKLEAKVQALVAERSARPPRAPEPRLLGSAAADGDPPASAAPDPDEEAALATEDDPGEPARDRRRVTVHAPLLEASFGPRAVGRSLTFTDNVSGAPGYNLPLATALAAEVVVFPGAHLPGWLGQLGLAGTWESSIAARTQGRDGQQSHATRHRLWTLGARGRLPLERATLLGGLDLGQQRFDIDLPEPVTLSPAVSYRFLRPSLSGRIALDDFAVTLSAGYLHVLSLGGLGDARAFPRAQVRGFEAGARLAYAVARELEVDAGAELKRFAFSMNVRPGDPLIAGGAVDDYVTASLRLTYRLP
jgi:hypothetical protein